MGVRGYGQRSGASEHGSQLMDPQGHRSPAHSTYGDTFPFDRLCKRCTTKNLSYFSKCFYVVV